MVPQGTYQLSGLVVPLREFLLLPFLPFCRITLLLGHSGVGVTGGSHGIRHRLISTSPISIFIALELPIAIPLVRVLGGEQKCLFSVQLLPNT